MATISRAIQLDDIEIADGEQNINAKLSVASGIKTTSIKTGRATKNSSYTITDNDKVILADAGSENVDLTLPDASGNDGLEITVKKIDSTENTVTVSGINSQTIDGLSNKSTDIQNDFFTLISDNSNWWITG